MRAARCAWAIFATAAAATVPAILFSCGSGGESTEPQVVGPTREAIGRYIVMTSGCNDCHTPGYTQNPNVPESEWLTGVPVGWRGPWGTSYATNLRLSVVPYTEETFIKAMKARNDRPPMPWSSLHAMTDENLGCIYAYIRSLGPAGEQMPVDVPPGKEPATPYVSMEPVNGGVASTAPSQ